MPQIDPKQGVRWAFARGAAVEGRGGVPGARAVSIKNAVRQNGVIYSGAGNGTSAHSLRESAPASSACRRSRPLATNASRLLHARALAGSSPLPSQEKSTVTLRYRARHVHWSGQRDSNPRMSAWEADALPLGDARMWGIVYRGFRNRTSGILSGFPVEFCADLVCVRPSRGLSTARYTPLTCANIKINQYNRSVAQLVSSTPQAFITYLSNLPGYRAGMCRRTGAAPEDSERIWQIQPHTPFDAP